MVVEEPNLGPESLIEDNYLFQTGQPEMVQVGTGRQATIEPVQDFWKWASNFLFGNDKN